MSIIFITDMCDTLIKGNTTFLFLDNFFKKNKAYSIFRKIQKNIFYRILARIFFKFKFDINRKTTCLFLKKHSYEELYNHAKYMAEKKFLYNSSIVELINFCKKNKIEIYIASASLDFITAAVANKFQIKHISTELNYKNGFCLGTIKNDLLFTKKAAINNLLKQSNNSPVIFISDNIQDKGIIKMVSYGFGLYNRKNKNVFHKEKIKPFSNKSMQYIEQIITSNQQEINNE